MRGSSRESIVQDLQDRRLITGSYASHRRYLDFSSLTSSAVPDRDNAIDLYIGDEYMDLLADGAWEKVFKVKPPVFTAEEKRAWLDRNTDVICGSDAFFPFSDNIERAHKSGVKYIAQPAAL